MTRDKLIGMGRKFRARRKVACTPTLKFILGAIDTQAGDAEKVTLFYFCGFLGLNLILQETDTSATSDSPPYIHTPPAAPVKRSGESLRRTLRSETTSIACLSSCSTVVGLVRRHH